MKRKHLQHATEKYVSKAFNVLELNQSIGEAVDTVRNIEEAAKKTFFYVLDEKDHLIGIVNIRSLLMHDPSLPLSEVVQNKSQVVSSAQSMFDALAIMQKYHLLAVPVLKKGIFIGVVEIQEYFEEELHLTSKRKKLQIFQMLGVLVEEAPNKNLLKKYKQRMPWVFCNMLGGIICAVISEFYEALLLKVIILAMFIPLVLSLSESISMQAMTVSIYLMTYKKQKWKKVLQYMLREIKLLFLIALTASLTVGLLSLLWHEGYMPSVVIFISILVSILITAIIGAVIPIILHRCRLDPKIASGPIVLMFADMITTLIYLSLGFFLLM